MYHTNTQNLTCPHCGLTRVQKVSVKVANETIGGRYVGTSFQGGLVLQSSSNQSYSAFLLSPPKQPIYREPGECFFIVLGIMVEPHQPVNELKRPCEDALVVVWAELDQATGVYEDALVVVSES